MRIRPQRCRDAFMSLAEASHYPVAIMPDAKGFFPEQYQRYMGLYWSVSCPQVIKTATAPCQVFGASVKDVRFECGWLPRLGTFTWVSPEAQILFFSK